MNGVASHNNHARPDEVESSSASYDSIASTADKADYEDLRKRYLLPRVRVNAELGGGMRLRRQQRRSLIEEQQHTYPGFKKLKRRIDALQRRGKHPEIYALLRQLRDWEITNHPYLPLCLRDDSEDSMGDKVVEIVDLTETGEDEEDKDIVDVDKFITEVLLVKVIKADPDVVPASSTERVIVKSEEVKRGVASQPGKSSSACGITEVQEAGDSPGKVSHAGVSDNVASSGVVANGIDVNIDDERRKSKTESSEGRLGGRGQRPGKVGFRGKQGRSVDGDISRSSSVGFSTSALVKTEPVDVEIADVDATVEESEPHAGNSRHSDDCPVAESSCPRTLKCCAGIAVDQTVEKRSFVLTGSISNEEDAHHSGGESFDISTDGKEEKISECLGFVVAKSEVADSQFPRVASASAETTGQEPCAVHHSEQFNAPTQLDDTEYALLSLKSPIRTAESVVSSHGLSLRIEAAQESLVANVKPSKPGEREKTLVAQGDCPTEQENRMEHVEEEKTEDLDESTDEMEHLRQEELSDRNERVSSVDDNRLESILLGSVGSTIAMEEKGKACKQIEQRKKKRRRNERTPVGLASTLSDPLAAAMAKENPTGAISNRRQGKQPKKELQRRKPSSYEMMEEEDAISMRLAGARSKSADDSRKKPALDSYENGPHSCDDGDDEEESRLLASLGSTVANSSTYEADVLRDAASRDASTLTGIGFPDLRSLAPSYKSVSNKRAVDNAKTASSFDLPHILTVLSRTKSKLALLENGALKGGTGGNGGFNESREANVLRMKLQILMSYCRDVARLNLADKNAHGVVHVDVRAEKLTEKRRSNAIIAAGKDAMSIAAFTTALPAVSNGDVDSDKEVGRGGLQSSLDSMSMKSLTPAEILERAKKGLLPEDDFVDGDMSDGNVRITSSSKMASFGKQALVERKASVAKAFKRKSIMQRKREEMGEASTEFIERSGRELLELRRQKREERRKRRLAKRRRLFLAEDVNDENVLGHTMQSDAPDGWMEENAKLHSVREHRQLEHKQRRDAKDEKADRDGVGPPAAAPVQKEVFCFEIQKPHVDEHENDDEREATKNALQVKCPLCTKSFRVNSGHNADAFLSSHIDECQMMGSSARRSVPPRKAAIVVSYAESSDEEKSKNENRCTQEQKASGEEKTTVTRSAASSRKIDTHTQEKDILSGQSKLEKFVAKKNDAKPLPRKSSSAGKEKVSNPGKKSYGTRKLLPKTVSRSSLPSSSSSSNTKESKISTYSSARDDIELMDYEDRIDEWVESGVDKMRDMDEADSAEKPPGAARYPDFLTIPAWVNNRLFPYQRMGVRWMWELHRQGAGGVVGDEMGLGKTVQVSSFLGAMASCRKLDSILIISPATMLDHWLRELATWAPGLRRILVHKSGETDGYSREISMDMLRSMDEWLWRARSERTNERIDLDEDEDDLISSDKEEEDEDNFCGTGFAFVTTFENIRRSAETWTSHKWSYVVMDEGHKIRNPDADVTLACKRLRTPHRLLLSGTPIQNDLRELWSLFDFVFPGRLGTLPAFEAEFAEPIKRGGYTNASPMQVKMAYRCALVVRDLINPYLLRRQKKDVKEVKRLPGKTEQVLFCRLSDTQRALYEAYLQSDEVHQVLRGNMQSFRAITSLRKICNHPDLICGPGMTSYDTFIEQNGNIGRETIVSSSSDDENSVTEDECLVESSGKLTVLAKILPLWYKQGHRVLIFCQWMKMLNIVQKFLLSNGWKFTRIDGKTNVGSRQQLVDKFNSDTTFFAMLLTTRTGGVGLNLTGADRIILYDPDWNPQTDAQARERAWRFGQKNAVTVYRLITAGTIEEKIYHRQIFKTALSNQVLQDPRQRRLFSQKDLKDLFTLRADVDGITETGEITKGAGVINPEDVKSAGRKEGQDVNKPNESDDTLNSVLRSKGLAAVFDHNFVDRQSSVGKARNEIEMEEEAKKVANRAAKALQDSFSSTETEFAPTWTGSKETNRHHRFGNTKRVVTRNFFDSGNKHLSGTSNCTITTFEESFGGSSTAGLALSSSGGEAKASGAILANLRQRQQFTAKH